ncbi:hypothetical protein [Aquimarina agarivorans]|uniref:hypothetical protein n=1 Tax=Aquimarina agarivorans TaxID=980584 RepID=UPI000248EFE8|nr:hypothetical protein [Aquimarina agarivorans]
MAKTSNTETSPRNADTVICENIKIVNSEALVAKSLYEANKILKESKNSARSYKLCTLDKAKESKAVYEDMLSCVTVGGHKKAEIIQTNVDEYVKMDAEIGKLIKDTSKLLNQMRIKIEEAHNAACAMSNCFENKIITVKGKSKKEGEKENAASNLKDLLNSTKSINERGQNAFESIVAIAGVQTFTNTSRLKKFATDLNTAVKSFKSIVESNITSTTEEVKNSTTDLITTEIELSKITCDQNDQGVLEDGLTAVHSFVCKGKYDDNLLNICRDTLDCYCDDGYTKRKKNRNSRQQTANVD